MKRKFLITALGAAIFGLVPAAPAMAQEVSEAALVQAPLDNIWVFIAGCLVFLMQAGFGLVEAGLTRAKNVANIMAKNMADMCVGGIAFWAVGYGFAFGGGNLIGTDSFFLNDFGAGDFDGLYTGYTPFFFQVMFAATAVTIASGAMAGRTKIQGYLIFSAVMTAFIYPVVVHMFWSGEGILNDARQLLRLRDDLATEEARLGERRMELARRYLDGDTERVAVPREVFDAWFEEQAHVR